MTKTVLLVFGTRPEAIKMLPVASALVRDPDIEVKICVTAQHRGMLDQVIELFDLKPQYDLDIMVHAQGLTQITTSVLTGLADVIEHAKPDRVLVHGDTTTSMAASIAAFYARVPVGHVEAGLRSGDPAQPWPEETNRRITDVIADQFFAPTTTARDNLLRENAAPDAIHVTGNTVIDALQMTVAHIAARPDLNSALRKRFPFLTSTRRLLLVTAHRRESFGAPFESICQAIKGLARAYPIDVVYPVHPNPHVREVAYRLLEGEPRVHLIEPLEYLPFVFLMQRSTLILTDSGGIQEEGPALGKPVLVMREVTERPEAVAAGTVRLVGTEKKRIFDEAGRLLEEPAAYDAMSRSHNPYGDGRAAGRIASVIAGRPYDAFTG